SDVCSSDLQTQPRTVGAPAPGANACPPVRTEAVLLRGPLQPNRIPMRIILHRLHQPRPDRVGYDISGQRLEVIVPAHRPIMKTPLPYAPPDSPRTNTPHPPPPLGRATRHSTASTNGNDPASRHSTRSGHRSPAPPYARY